MIAKANPFGDGKVPQPGEGPDIAARDSGFYDVLFVGEMPDGRSVRLAVKGDRDPGYGSTSKMIAEAALCLAREAPATGGIWTPGALMGEALTQRLVANAGLSFELETSD